jgi:hypothetical protein
MNDTKKKDIKLMVEKLLLLDDTGIKVINIQTEALYARQLLDEKQSA